MAGRGFEHAPGAQQDRDGSGNRRRRGLPCYRRTCCGAPPDASDVFTRKRWPSWVTSKE